MRRFAGLLIAVLLCAAALPADRACAQQGSKPNIVFILADDLGWGSVGFNGQNLIQTPNLDMLAQGGMVLTNAYACPTCAPSRASLMTGFHQGHSSVDGNDELNTNTAFRAEDIMVPQVLAPAGYTSAVFGKWGFGASGSTTNPMINDTNSLPTAHGFDEFYGYLNHGAAHDYFYPFMWQTVPNANPNLPPNIVRVNNNGGPGAAAEYSHDLIAEHSEDFIAAHAGDTDPFYMQVSYTIPHFEIGDISDSRVPHGLDEYDSTGWSLEQKEYASMITRMDASIGSLVQKLKDPNGDHDESDSILNNTLIMFTSDNGPSAEDQTIPTVANPGPPPPFEFFNANGQFRGGKFEAYEGGIHMPAFAYWHDTIAPGTSTEYRTDMADFMATAADLAGTETPVGIDGTSIVPVLTGNGRMRERDYIVIEQQGSRPAQLPDADQRVTRWTIIRQDGMKLIRFDNETSELYDLANDPDENSPLNLSVPANAAIFSELEADAIAEGVTRAKVQYRTWTGGNGANVQADASWDGVGPPNTYWSAVMANNTASAKIAHVSADVSMLGLEIRGGAAAQVVDVHPDRTLTGRNEVRIKANGRVELSNGTLASNRWIDVKAGGEIRGQGDVIGDVYNEGTLSPGKPTDSPSWAIAPPAALPAANLDTAVVTAVAFDFSGTQDEVPLFATSTQSQYVEVTKGLDWSAGTGPRWSSGGSNAGNELNWIGHGTSTLDDAIAAENYISFTIDPISGAGFTPSSITFNVRRNGTAAARNFAILTSVGGFASSAAALSQQLLNLGQSDTAQKTLTATISTSQVYDGPVEFRLYGWGATVNTGNTHINAVSMTGRFVGLPTLEFNLAGTQTGTPVTTLTRSDSNLTLNAGLQRGSGLSTQSATGELQISGFSSGATAQSAIGTNDYLGFKVQPIAGLAMYPDSVSFTLWRQNSSSASDYALYSNIGGFASGQELAPASHYTLTGSSNKLTVTGSFASPQPTTNEIEFRLYGWNAGAPDLTHITAASMRARYASVAGTPLDPTGSLHVEGDLFHLAGGVIAIDLGGQSQGMTYDWIDVDGKVELEGDLSVSLADLSGSPFAPGWHNTFTILSATQGVAGVFGDVDLPLLANGLDWKLSYATNAVTLGVILKGDFNDDGTVNSADYVLWRKRAGTADEYDLWRKHYGITVGGGGAGQDSADTNVPEPTGIILFLSAIAAWGSSGRRRFN